MSLETMQTWSGFYLTISSKQSKDLFPRNKPCSFRVRLNERLDFLTMDYEVALVDITCSIRKLKDNLIWKPIIVNLNIVENQNILGISDSALRYTAIKIGSPQNYEFNHNRYVPVCRIRANELEFTINNGMTHSPATFMTNVTTCTLHFRKKHSIWLTT